MEVVSYIYVLRSIHLYNKEAFANLGDTLLASLPFWFQYYLFIFDGFSL